ncbi:MAG: DNA modification methylase [Fusobacterium necrophorum]|nr:DNA modification methylase [Fusobacterium necrophorum]
MEIIKLNIHDIEKDNTNPRKVTEAQKALYRKLISKFGMILPVVIDNNNKSMFDDAKLEVAEELGIQEINCVRVTDLSPEEFQTIRIAEVHALELGEWDYNLLLKELEKLGQEFAELTGFDFEEIKAKIEEELDNLEDIEEIETPEIQGEPYSRRGDIYLLGIHRLMCGDSTNMEDVKTLMNGELANLMVTDPPYNIDYESENGLKIQNDNLSKEEFYQFLLNTYLNAKEILEQGAAFYIFYAETEAINFRAALAQAGLKYSQTLIWEKNGFNLSRQDYNWRHEPCLYGWKLGKAHYFIHDFTQDTVIKENKPLRNDVHPTMKPIHLIARLISNSSKKGWNVLDLFGGSGSTLIAAEQLERRAFLMEFDEKYVDVIVKRYASMGKDNISLIRDRKEYSWEEIQENFK